MSPPREKKCVYKAFGKNPLRFTVTYVYVCGGGVKIGLLVDRVIAMACVTNSK